MRLFPGSRWFAHCTLLAAAAACCVVGNAFAQSQDQDALAAGFKNPPAAAKPRVWWHWLDGNVSEAGIRKDLLWLNQVGVGGVHNFDAALAGMAGESGPPRLVEERVAYLSPRWRQMFRYAVDQAHQLGMEFTIAASPGWSETGGPWVRPEQGMKKLVWSETRISGGKPYTGRLAIPPRVTGPFQNVPFEILPFAVEGQKPEYYADAAVIAYRQPTRQAAGTSVKPVITTSAGDIDSAKLADGDLARAVELPFGAGDSAWIQFTHAAPRTVQAATVSVARPAGGAPSDMATGGAVWLEVSDDGKTFRRLVDVPRNGAPQQTLSFAPTTARIFRLVLQRPETRPGILELLGLPSAPKPTAHQILECVLHTEPRVNRFEDKAGFTNRAIMADEDTLPVADSQAISQQAVIDLTDKMKPDGSLDWTPPRGSWVVLRFGYSLTGRTNHPASAEGTGLEVDKLSRRHVKAYFESYLAEYSKTLDRQLIGKQGLQYMLTDSYEAGISNWTDDILAEFSKRRGYDARPWLPALTGRVIASSAASDRFLWDFRQTLSELIGDAHYGQLSELLRECGMGRYGESHEGGRAFLGDGMQAKKSADVPMGALWAAAPWESGATYEMDIRESASVAHIYGQNLVAAESLTAFGNPFGFAPETLKPHADRELAMGLNRFVIHTSAHQPDDRPGPGVTLGPFGQWFTRHETWAEQAGPWVSYLARSSYLLQQGRFVADIALLYGEDNNITNLFGAAPPAIPAGYNFDFVNADALLNVFSVKDGNLVANSGMRYRLLVLDASTQRMSLPLLRRIRDFVKQGAVVVGARPTTTPSLADDEAQFQAIADELWGSGSAKSPVLTSPLPEALRHLSIAPDCLLGAADAGGDLTCVHRELSDGDLYFVTNRSAKALTVDANFRVSGKAPEIWRADSGEIRPASYRMEASRTTVPLQLEPHDAVFVVFRSPTNEARRDIVEPSWNVMTTLEGAWDVSFAPDRGAPPRARFERLESWAQSADSGIKYFSGTATYAKTITVNKGWLSSGSRIRLDLGEVKNLAEVLVNGKSLGVLWKAPFRVDITEALRAGDNRVEVEVTNLWPNRMIGDKQPGAQKIAHSTFDPFRADTPLLPSGLLGPVTLSQQRRQ